MSDILAYTIFPGVLLYVVFLLYKGQGTREQNDDLSNQNEKLKAQIKLHEKQIKQLKTQDKLWESQIRQLKEQLIESKTGMEELKKSVEKLPNKSGDVVKSLMKMGALIVAATNVISSVIADEDEYEEL